MRAWILKKLVYISWPYRWRKKRGNEKETERKRERDMGTFQRHHGSFSPTVGEGHLSVDNDESNKQKGNTETKAEVAVHGCSQLLRAPAAACPMRR